MDSEMGYPALLANRKSGAEPLHSSGQPLSATVLDFWRWSASDLLDNATRGVLAEFIVATALGRTGGVRATWDAYDLVTESGLKVEVKSAAYLQSWAHRNLSTIGFDIRPTCLLDGAAITDATERRRRADVYVFCLLTHRDKATVDPLNLDQWTFYVLPAAVLDQRCPTQKRIGLAPLLRLSPVQTDFHHLAAALQATPSTG